MPSSAALKRLTLLEPQASFGDELLRMYMVCPQSGKYDAKGVKMPSRDWELCQILQQSHALLTLRTPRQRLRRRMSMRAREGLCFSIGKYQVFSPQSIGIVYLVSSA